jgi:hypothetical protein
MDDTIDLADKAFREYLLAKHELIPELSLERSDEEASIVDQLDGEILILVRGPLALYGLRAALMWMETVQRPRPTCDECGGDLGGDFIGSIEDHVSGCPRFPR